MTVERPLSGAGPALPHATFRVANVVLRYEALEPDIRFMVRDVIRPFMGPETAAPDCVLACNVGSVTPSKFPISFSAPVWDLRHLPNGAEEMVFRSTEPWARLRTNIDFSQGILTFSDVRDRPSLIYPGDYPIAEYLACRLIGKRGGLHLHASAVTFGDGAYVFLGHSGAGKSTLAHLAETSGGKVLSDDRTIITVGDGGAVAWGTPWHGSLQRTSATSAPIIGLALLVQSDRDRLSEVPATVALKEIFVRLIQPRLDRGEVDNTLGAVERLLAAIPLHKFEFTQSPSAIETLRRGWRAA